MKSRSGLRCLWMFGFAVWVTAAFGQYVADATIVAGSGYSGGRYWINGTPNNYGWNSDGWGGGTASTGTHQGICAEEITVIFKWAGDVADIPKLVLIEETCTANAYNTGSPGVTTGDVSNGRLGDEVLPTTDHSNPPPYFQLKKVGYNTNDTIIKHYSIIEDPGGTIELKITPSANCLAPGGGTASVRYKATATP